MNSQPSLPNGPLMDAELRPRNCTIVRISYTGYVQHKICCSEDLHALPAELVGRLRQVIAAESNVLAAFRTSSVSQYILQPATRLSTSALPA